MTTLFRRATLRSFAPGRPRIEHADILISGTTIQTVAPAGTIADAPGITVIDAAGHLIMPGLINAHFHSPLNWKACRSKSSCFTKAPTWPG